jgi:hypothetical protein
MGPCVQQQRVPVAGHDDGRLSLLQSSATVPAFSQALHCDCSTPVRLPEPGSAGPGILPAPPAPPVTDTDTAYGPTRLVHSLQWALQALPVSAHGRPAYIMAFIGQAARLDPARRAGSGRPRYSAGV